MKDLEKALWLAVGVYGVYAAGNAVRNQFNKVERQGADLLNVAILLGLGATFLIRLDRTAVQTRRFLG